MCKSGTSGRRRRRRNRRSSWGNARFRLQHQRATRIHLQQDAPPPLPLHLLNPLLRPPFHQQRNSSLTPLPPPPPHNKRISSPASVVPPNLTSSPISALAPNPPLPPPLLPTTQRHRRILRLSNSAVGRNRSRRMGMGKGRILLLLLLESEEEEELVRSSWREVVVEQYFRTIVGRVGMREGV